MLFVVQVMLVNPVSAVVLVEQVKREKWVRLCESVITEKRDVCISGDAGYDGLPGLKGQPGDSGSSV